MSLRMMSTQCSAFIEHKFVEGGGVRYNEVLDVSNTVGAEIGVPIVAKANGSYGKTSKVLVQYELTGKCCQKSQTLKVLQNVVRQIQNSVHDVTLAIIQGKGAIFTEVSKEASAQGKG